MATTTTTRAAATFPVYTGDGGGALCVAYGSYTFAANPAVNDVIQLCRVPAGSTIIGGFLRMQDIDGNASATVDIDIGWPANGGSGAFDTAQSAGLLNSGVLNGTTVANYTPEAGSVVPFQGLLQANGVVTVTRETIIQALVNAVAATFVAGTISVVVHYTTP